MRENLPRLVAAADDPESDTPGLPKFVKDELQAYLDCGLLCRGFLKAVCESCRQSVLLAFSCKGRGFCPSCGARRMEDETEHIVERILPDEPLRQWVLSLPFQIRSLVAHDAEIFAAVTRIFVEEIFRHIEKNIGTNERARTHCGAIAFLQRFGSTINLNPHVHALALDGAYLERPESAEGEDAHLEFHAIAAPTPAQIEDVSRRVARRVIRMLQRQGLADAEQIIPHDAPPTPERAVQHAAAGIFPLFARVRDGVVEPIYERSRAGRSAEVRGFSTHAGVSAVRSDKAARRRIVRYCLRPPFAEKQVSCTRDGRVAFELRHPRSNGATHVVMSELGFVRKIAALIPPPRQHQGNRSGALLTVAAARIAGTA